MLIRLGCFLMLIFFLMTPVSQANEFSNYGVIATLELPDDRDSDQVLCYGAACYVKVGTALHKIDVKNPYEPKIEKQKYSYFSPFWVDNKFVYSLIPAPQPSNDYVLALYTRFDWELLSTSTDEVWRVGFETIRTAADLVYIIDLIDFYVFDVSKTSDIKLIDKINGNASMWDFEIDTSYAYIATDDGLTIINISDPSQLEIESTLPLSSSCKAIAVDNSIAFLVSDSGDIFAVNISNPLDPKLVSSIQIIGSIADIAIDSNYAYIVGGGMNPIVIDISDPSNMKIVYAMANDHHNGWGGSIQVRQGIAFIAGQTPDFFVMGEMVEDENSGGGGGGGCFVKTISK